MVDVVNEGRRFSELWVQRGEHRINVRDYAGREPAIVLMHGFPDNLHLYDRRLPHLDPSRRVVTFDFLGWAGRTSRPGIRTRRRTRPVTSTR